MDRILYLSTIVLFLGYSLCQTNNELDVSDIEKQVKENIPGLENFNTSKLPTEEDLDRLLKEKCVKNGGGEEAFNALKNQETELKDCLTAQLNATEIQHEIEQSKKTGSMDEVFGKYCRKYPQIYKCVEAVTDKVKPCLAPAEQDTLNKTLKIVGELKEFICYKDGDRIAMFIAEGGVECLESRQEQLQECANKTIGARIPTEMSVKSLPMFLFTDRECHDFDEIRECFNLELEKCKDSTPANIIDAFFKFLKKHMPCGGSVAASPTKEKLDGAEDGDSSSSAITVSLFLTGFSILFSKFL